jgi:hypothetical protein
MWEEGESRLAVVELKLTPFKLLVDRLDSWFFPSPGRLTLSDTSVVCRLQSGRRQRPTPD